MLSELTTTLTSRVATPGTNSPFTARSDIPSTPGPDTSGDPSKRTRTRRKKIKCSGEFPCNRCNDNGLVCTTVREKMEYKQSPKGYVEALENTHFALIATVHKLYSMVRNSQPWELGEPELNDRGQPVIHNVVQKLGCILPESDIGLPSHSFFPEDKQGMHELAVRLEGKQRIEDATDIKDVAIPASSSSSSRDTDSSSFPRTDRASTTELDHCDFTSNDINSELGKSAPNLEPQPSPPVPNFPAWSIQPPTSEPYLHQQHNDMMHFVQAMAPTPMQNPNLQDPDLKPYVLSCAHPDVMVGIGDPMIFVGDPSEP